jgi:hypothetical protein
MKSKFRVSGRYTAKYPDGHYIGDIGISTQIAAKSEKKAIDFAADKAKSTFGYVDLRWVDVRVTRVNLPN